MTEVDDTPPEPGRDACCGFPAPDRGPGDDGYDVRLDRVAGPVGTAWRTAPATGGDVGITLQDALASLGSFGHGCT